MGSGELEEEVEVLLDVEVEVMREDEPELELELEVEETTGFVDLEEEREVPQNSDKRTNKKLKQRRNAYDDVVFDVGGSGSVEDEDVVSEDVVVVERLDDGLDGGDAEDDDGSVDDD